MKQILAVVGGRSELARLAPALRVIRDQHTPAIKPRIMHTGESSQMVWSTGALFGLVPERQHALSSDGLSLADLSWQISNAVGHELDSRQTDLVIVQGCSMTAMLAGQQAFLRHIPLVHVDGFSPGSDQAASSIVQSNRRMLSALASFRCVPHRKQADELRRLGYPAYEVGVTGSSAVEAARLLLDSGYPSVDGISSFANTPPSGLYVGIRDEETSRETSSEIGFALATLAHDRPDLPIRVATSNGNSGKGLLPSILGALSNVQIIYANDYLGHLQSLGSAALVLTNADDIAEEALAVHRPVVLMQEYSQPLKNGHELPISSIPATQDSIVNAIEMLLAEHQLTNSKAKWTCESVIGDGNASQRIVQLLNNWARNHVLTAHSFEPYDSRFQTKSVGAETLSTLLMH